MLKITILKDVTRITFELEGKLSGPWVNELERCWQATVPVAAGVSLRVYLRAVSFIDSAGRELLAEMHRQGAELVGVGCMTEAIVEEIAGGRNGSATRRGKGGTLKKTLATLLLATSLGLVPGLGAQEKPPLKLTLHDAVQLALKQNPQVQIAILNLAQSGQDRNIARSQLLPQASLAASDEALRGNIETALGRRFPGIPQHIGPFQIFTAGTQFGMPIFDLTLWRRWQSAGQAVRASQAQSESVREQVVLLVVSQYLGCLRADANVRAAQSRVDLAQALYDQAADLQKHGVATGLDALRANVELQNEKQTLIVARTALETSLYGLVRLLNLDPHQTIELDDKLGFFETPDFGVAQSLESAYQSRPELRVLEAQTKALYDQKRAVMESRLPALTFTGGWAQQGISAATVIPTYQYQVGVEMPLFTSGRIRAEVAKADLELKKIDQQRQDLRSQIALEVKTAIANLDSARHEVDVANLGVQLAQEEVGQARDRFSAGVANNIEVIEAQDALARANDNQIAALYRFNQARADLARALGQMESLYSK